MGETSVNIVVTNGTLLLVYIAWLYKSLYSLLIKLATAHTGLRLIIIYVYCVMIK